MVNGKITSMQFTANLSFFKWENYERWVVQVKLVFRFQDVTEIVNDEVLALEENANDIQQAAHKKRRKKDGKDLLFIH